MGGFAVYIGLKGKEMERIFNPKKLFRDSHKRPRARKYFAPSLSLSSTYDTFRIRLSHRYLGYTSGVGG